MEYEWNDAKAVRNKRKHGLDFRDAAAFDWRLARITEDHRHAYGEARYRAFGPLCGRIVLMVYTLRGERCRIISLRKANAREVKWYEQQS
jgi:uncharacterized DUF497 family protein